MNNNPLVTKNNTSLFDSIKHVDKNENEFWSARELMLILNYKKWDKFKSAIETAIENIETVVNNSVEHFFPVEVKTNGRPKLDYKLTRLACYHIALSCDSRGNNSIKMAKHYFAVKTREAEIVIPQQNDRIRELELQVELAKTQKYLLDKRNSIASVHGLNVLAQLEGREVIEVEKQTIEVIDNISGNVNRIMSANELKTYIKKNTGQTLKSKKQLVNFLKQHGRDDLLIPVRRQHTTEDINADRIDEAIELFISRDRQMLLGE